MHRGTGAILGEDVKDGVGDEDPLEEVGEEVGKEEGGFGLEKGVDGGILRKEASPCSFNGVSFAFSFFG